MTSPTSGASPAPDTSPQPVPSPALDQTAAAMTDGGSTVTSPTLELRQCVVTAVDLAAATCSVAIGGDDASAAVPNVHYLSNYKPTVGDTCWVLVNGPDLLAMDRDGKFGAAAWAGMGSAFIATQETRASGTYGDLATVGPVVAGTIPASGRLLVCVSADVASPLSTGYDDAWMSFAVTGASTIAASDQNALMCVTNSQSFSSYSTGVGGGGNFHSHSFSGSGSDSAGTVFISGSTGSASGDSSHAHFVTPPTNAGQTEIMASRVVLLTGLTPGAVTITAKYRTTTGTGTWKRRQIWALPL